MKRGSLVANHLEIVVTSLEDAQEAAAGGALSVEVVQDLSVGGITPPLELVARIRDAVALTVRVIVRPTAKSFVYTPKHLDNMLSTIEALQGIGVEGIVFGALTPENDLDSRAVHVVIEAAGALEITFHRAIDQVRDPTDALSTLRGRAARILASGSASSAWEGRFELKRWVEQFGDSFVFACAGSVNLSNIGALATMTNCHECHVGGAARGKVGVARDKVRMLKQAMDA